MAACGNRGTSPRSTRSRRTGTFGRAAARARLHPVQPEPADRRPRACGRRPALRPAAGRPARPSSPPLGRLVLEEGRSLLARQGRASDAVDRYLAGGGRVDVGTFQTVTNALLPDVVRRVRRGAARLRGSCCRRTRPTPRPSTGSTCCSSTATGRRGRSGPRSSATSTSCSLLPGCSPTVAVDAGRARTAARWWRCRRCATRRWSSRPWRRRRWCPTSSSAPPTTRASPRWCGPASGSP